MSEIVLQTIVDKLEAIEIALLKQQNVIISDEAQQAMLNELYAFRCELSMMAAGVKISNERANEILLRLDTLTTKFLEPVKDRVTHHHYLHKGLVVSIALFIVSMLFLVGGVNSHNNKK